MSALVIAVVVIAIGIVAFGITWTITRRPRAQDNVAGFRRHMDALSPEARRSVIDGVREARRDEEEN